MACLDGQFDIVKYELTLFDLSVQGGKEMYGY